MKLIVFNGEDFNLRISKHAEIRLEERNIELSEVQEVLISYENIFENEGKKVAEKNIKGRKVRVVFKVIRPNLILITTIIRG